MAEKEKKEKENTNETELEKALKEENESLIKELEEEKKKSDDFKDKWMRNVAEFDNYKKRNARLWQDAFDEGKKDVIVKLLPIGDHLDAALNMGLDEKTAEGIKLLVKKYKDILAGLEIEEIDPVGEKFDPNFAEAIMQAEKEEGEESDTVKTVFQKGYKCKDKIIRYAKVSVIK